MEPRDIPVGYEFIGSTTSSRQVEVLDARRTLSDAELQYIEVRGAVYTSLVNTYKAMGGGWVIQARVTADEADIPQK